MMRRVLEGETLHAEKAQQLKQAPLLSWVIFLERSRDSKELKKSHSLGNHRNIGAPEVLQLEAIHSAVVRYPTGSLQCFA